MPKRPDSAAPQKEWDRWWSWTLRSEERAATTTATAEAKAAIGPGVVALSTYPQVSLSPARSPQKMMAEAEALFTSNLWVASAERAIVGRFVDAPWHLETAEGDTVDDTSPPAQQAALALLKKPSQRMSRRQLWSLTLRHMGLPGNGFWYLDQRLLTGGPPLALLYINPCRMSPIEDEHGYLLGWVMDKADNPLTPRGAQAVPFEVDELRHFKLDEPDTGHWGIGIAQAAYAKLMIDRLGDSHTAQVLASGGRIAGLLSPKQGASTMSEDQWQATVRDYRNIVGDPDAAKRLHVVRGPVDFTETASKPSELQLAELNEASRENILAGWNVPLSQIGIMQSSGLNSGEHVKFEEAALWQGAIMYRGTPFIEQVQSIVDLFGLGLKLVVDTPTFDDQQPLFENADKAKVVPLTINQRREMVGQDPLDEKVYGDLGNAIFIDKSMVRIDPFAPAMPEAPEPFPAPPKAVIEALPDYPAIGARIRNATQPALRKAVDEVLGLQREAIADLAAKHYDQIKRKPNDQTVWWRGWDAAWAEQISPVIDRLARRTIGEVERHLAPPKADDAFTSSVSAYLRARLLERVRDIDTFTRQEVAAIISTGLAEGVSPAELSVRIQAATVFDDVRAERIARTETAFAQNAAALRTFGDFGVAEVQAIDGDVDAECAARNGKVFPLSEAEGISDHPNGTLDWIPLTAAVLPKAQEVTMPGQELHFHNLPDSMSLQIPPPQVTVNVPEAAVYVQPQVSAPEVKVDVHVPEAPPATVNVAAPQVTVEAPSKADGPQEVVVVQMPDRVHKAIRDKGGKITSSVETDG